MAFTDEDLEYYKEWTKTYPYVTTDKDFDKLSALKVAGK